MPGKLTFDRLRRLVSEDEIDTVIVAQTDMQGRLMGKRFQAQHFLEHAREETHACDYLLALDMEMEPVPGYTAAGWEQGYGDHTLVPDMETLRLCPWLEGTALVLADALDHATHDPVPHSPRAILKRQVARAEAMGLSPFFASELEFYLFRETYEEAEEAGYGALTPSGPYNEDYHIFQTTKEEEVMRAIRTGLYGADIPVESTKGEASAGQAEINIRYADAVTAADRHVVAKNAIKEIAWGLERSVTFMAKWSDVHAGSSCHIHQSMAKDKTNAFHAEGAEHAMSETMRAYLAGLLAHSAETTLFLAPFVNSYKRFVAATFAPTKAVWSVDNRTAGYRVCGPGTAAVRIENRIGGADLNPYLAFAAQIAAGLAGIEQTMTLGAEFRGNAYAEDGPSIPKSLRDAADAADGSAMLRAALGDAVVDHYVHAARWEVHEADRIVTDWDRRRGFERA